MTTDYVVKCPAIDFLHEQSVDKNTSSACSGYAAVFSRYAQMGGAGLTTAMTHEANKNESILEFIKGSLRLLYFVDGNIAMLTNGYVKKSQKANPTAVAEAVRIKTAYIKSKGSAK